MNSSSVYDTSGWSRTGDPYRNPAISTYTSASATACRHTCAGWTSRGGEICHIGDGIARPRHRRLRRRHKRPRRRQPPQLTGVTKNGEPRAFRTADLQ